MSLPIIIAISVLLAAAPAVAQDDLEHDDHEAEAHEELVVMDATTRAEFGIEITAAGPGVLRLRRTLPGEVRANADRLAHIVPRYEGIVHDVRAAVGDRVRAGQTLAVVEGDASLTEFNVRTALGGTVIERHVSLGEAVSRDQALFVVADLDSVWIDIAVYLRDLDAVREGDPVTVSCGRHDAGIAARIGYVAPVVDEATRTATARVVLPNGDRHWRPGMFVTAVLETSAEPVDVAVLPSAVFNVEGRTCVFVETDEGFVPRPVTVGRRTDDLLEITAGLAPDEPYVVHGGFTLKAELEKASFGDGHNH
ncbi:MAG: HlyD family efflux transporter periplasmic adaptor subunit [bacterium]|nr:HlyD family efflux transporter periplasmic adaptor subunit [bacterium]